MTEERILKIVFSLQNIGYQVDDETLKKIKPFKDAIEAEILQEIEDEAINEEYNQALKAAGNALMAAGNAVRDYFITVLDKLEESASNTEVDELALIPNKEIRTAIKNLKRYTEKDEEILEELREQNQEEQKEWIEITTRPLTDEEKEDEAFNDFAYIYTCETPDDAQEVLITTRYGYVEQTTFYNDCGCYFENFEELGDVLAWRPLPEPFKEQKEREAQQ